jgi:hypothetical protein
MMPLAETIEQSSVLAEKIESKLAATPLKLADIAKGLKPRKVSVPNFQAEVRTFLEEQIRLGKMFCYPSGKNGAERYWNKDERHLLRNRAIELAVAPMTLSALAKSLAKEIKGVDAVFIESLVRDLVEFDQLFEHAPKTKKGKPQFCVTPPPPPIPPLVQPKHRKVIEKMAKDIQKLLDSTKASLDEVIEQLRKRFDAHSLKSTGAEPESSSRNRTTANAVEPAIESASHANELDELIEKEIENNHVVSLIDLRTSLPKEFQGSDFDRTILRMADEQRVILYKDVEPSRFTDIERAGYVQDGAHLYTTMSKRG